MKVFHRRGRGIRRPAWRRADALAESDAWRRDRILPASAAMRWRRKACRRCSGSMNSPLSASPAIPQRLPMIIKRIRQTWRAAIAARPDVMVIIDSPDFTHRVARRVRRANPSIPIVDYVSPSVWAWRPGRARAMRRYIDHVLALLPFEPEAHRKLGGPPCTYVGHPLVEQIDELRPNADEASRRESPTADSSGAAGQPQGRDQASHRAVPARRRAHRQDRSGRSTSSFRRPRISPMPSCAKPRIGRCGRRSWSSARTGARHSGARAWRSQNPERSRSNLRCRACRWSPRTRFRGSKPPIARRLITVSSAILANLVLRRKCRAGIHPGGMHAAEIVGCAAAAVPRQPGAPAAGRGLPQARCDHGDRQSRAGPACRGDRFGGSRAQARPARPCIYRNGRSERERLASGR